MNLNIKAAILTKSASTLLEYASAAQDDDGLQMLLNVPPDFVQSWLDSLSGVLLVAHQNKLGMLSKRSGFTMTDYDKAFELLNKSPGRQYMAWYVDDKINVCSTQVDGSSVKEGASQ